MSNELIYVVIECDFANDTERNVMAFRYFSAASKYAKKLNENLPKYEFGIHYEIRTLDFEG